MVYNSGYSLAADVKPPAMPPLMALRNPASAFSRNSSKAK